MPPKIPNAFEVREAPVIAGVADQIVGTAPVDFDVLRAHDQPRAVLEAARIIMLTRTEGRPSPDQVERFRLLSGTVIDIEQGRNPWVKSTRS